MAIFLNVGDQDLIFFRCPWPPFQSHFLTARSPHHVGFFCLCMNLNEQYRLILSYPPLMPQRTMIFTNWSQAYKALVGIYTPNSKSMHVLEKSKDEKD